MTIKVNNEIEVYEVNGEEKKGLRSDRPCLKVKSHWNRNEFIILQFDDGNNYTVLAKELEAAISNAKNIARF